MTSLARLHHAPGAAYEPPYTLEDEYAVAAQRFVQTGEVPVSLKCAVSLELMHDPVQTCEGHTYEHALIAEWLSTNKTDPCTGMPLRELNLVPNRTIKSQIEAFRAAVVKLGPDAIAKLPQPADTRPASIAARPADGYTNMIAPRSFDAPSAACATASGLRPPAPMAPHTFRPQKLAKPGPTKMPALEAPERATKVRFASLYANSLVTRGKARAAALRCNDDVEQYRSVIGDYLRVKRANEHQRLPYASTREEYTFSRKDIRFFNHVMHKLENLGRSVLSAQPKRRHKWELAINPFRRQLYNELYETNELVRAFAGSLPGGRTALPAMDDWTLGIKQRNRFGTYGWRVFKAANARAPMDLLGDVHTALLIDDSGSMTGRNWNEVRNLLGQIGPLLARYADPDCGDYKDMSDEDFKRNLLSSVHTQGFDVHFLNHPQAEQGLRTAADVINTFNRVHPTNGTPTGQRVNDILDAYMSTLRYDRNLKPLNLVILTDGADTDYPREKLFFAIEEHVSHVVQRGHPGWQLGVEFLQVGNDPAATLHLDDIEEEVDRHHNNLNCDVVGVTHMAYFNGEPLSAERLAQIMVQGIQAREQGYHRDFRDRRRVARAQRQQLEWQTRQGPGYYY